jgi:hypothetical protein
MSGIIAVYSLVISVLIAQDLIPPSTGSYSLFKYVRPSKSAEFSERTNLTRVQRVPASCERLVSRLDGTCRRLCHRHRRRHWRASIHASVQDLRGHGSDPHFRRSPGSLRVCGFGDVQREAANTDDDAGLSLRSFSTPRARVKNHVHLKKLHPKLKLDKLRNCTKVYGVFSLRSFFGL